MPFIQIHVPAGSLDAEGKQAMVAGVTDAVVAVEGSEAMRPVTFVHVMEVPDGGWGVGGTAYTLDQLRARLAAAAGAQATPANGD